MIIAFDIGINNLAYCLTDETGNIQSWENLNIKKDCEKKKLEFDDLSTRLINALHERFYDDSPSAFANLNMVLIENQPVLKNPVMKSVQMIVYTFFMMKKKLQNRNFQVKLVSASNKFAIKCKPEKVDIPDVAKYRKNKLLAIAYARHYLTVKEQADKWKQLFESSKKRDDLSDCLCLIIHHIETRSR